MLVGTFSSISLDFPVISSTAWSTATMSSEPNIPASGRMGMLVNPKQSHTGVMCVARLICIAFPGWKVERVTATLWAQASWKEWKFTASIFKLPGGATEQASSAGVALLGVQVQSTRVFLIIHQGFERAGCLDALARLFIRAFLREPIRVILRRIMDGTACLTHHASQGQVLEGRTEPTAGVPFHV